MKLFPPAKMPSLIQKNWQSLVWSIPSKEKTLYLTFDDGPTPEVTPWVLDLLKEIDAKATFFCIGKNVEAHPEIFKSILKEGHSIGNHTHNHLKGWKTPTNVYLENIAKAHQVMNMATNENHAKPLFRPPYGQIRPSQIKALKSTYRIIMWSVLSMDYKKQIKPKACARNVVDNASSGDIIVFHDSIKATANMKPALKTTLQYFSERGFCFKCIP